MATSHSSHRQSFVIVGASLAGAKAAEALRGQGFDGGITLLGDERHRPYERPPLSKGYLQGSSDRESVFVHPKGWYADNNVDLRLGTEVMAIDTAARSVTTAAGDRLAYDKLLLATGSTPRRLPLPGADLDGVHLLRRLEDSDRIKAAFEQVQRVVIVGAGWIGLETAAAARGAGLDVTVLESAQLPLVRVLGPRIAGLFADLHRDRGVDLRCEVTVAELVGAQGSVTGVRLGDGELIPADVVLVGVGIVPNAGLAERSGLTVDNGIAVDERLQTSDPDIYAAGDVANAYHPLLRRPIRVEHWANARRQGEVAAKAMLGQDVVHDRLPYFFSDQYDLGMEYTGYVEPGAHDAIVFRGDPGTGKYIAFWLSFSRVAAGMNVNTWDVADQIQALVASGRSIDVGRLADPTVPLEHV